MSLIFPNRTFLSSSCYGLAAMKLRSDKLLKRTLRLAISSNFSPFVSSNWQYSRVFLQDCRLASILIESLAMMINKFVLKLSIRHLKLYSFKSSQSVNFSESKKS